MAIPSIKFLSNDHTEQTISATSPLPVALVSSGTGAVPFLGTIAYDVFEVTVTPTITAGAYTAGDALGGLLTFASVVQAGGGGGEIVKVTILDLSKQSAPIDLVLFDRTFTATADNAPFGPTDADLANCLGFIPIANTDYSEFANTCVATKASGQQMPFPYRLAAAGSSLFGQMVIRNGDTFGAVADVTVKITVRRYV